MKYMYVIVVKNLYSLTCKKKKETKKRVDVLDIYSFAEIFKWFS